MEILNPMSPLPILPYLYDELPLWSAPFGLTLLDTVNMKKGMKVLDIGSGSGFPMIELAERLGPASMIYGVDPSADSCQLVSEKIAQKGISNAEIVQACAEALPFPDAFFDLIISNNGMNNVTDLKKTLSSCYRVGKPNAQMVMTMNLPETMMEFYRIFEETLAKSGRYQEIDKLKAHIFEKRKPIEFLLPLIESSGFAIKSVKTDEFKLRFYDGTSFLNHYFIRTAFKPSWVSVVSGSSVSEIFDQMETKLNVLAKQNGELLLTVPYICIDCNRKQ